METTTKRKSQPWWVIFLIIPILVSCNSPILWNVAVYVGDVLINKYAGPTIEKVIDTLLKKIFPGTGTIPEMRVIPDPDNPLHAHSSKTIKFDITDPRTQEHRVIELNPATFDWHPEASKWELDSKSKRILEKLEM